MLKTTGIAILTATAACLLAACTDNTPAPAAAPPPAASAPAAAPAADQSAAPAAAPATAPAAAPATEPAKPADNASQGGGSKL